MKKYDDIGHNPTIGSMYEGLTRDLLQKAIFECLDIRVVSGKIINSKREYSDQIDCMIVQGEGEKIPHTDLYIYHINNVIAVIEVKKNLYSTEVESAYQNLRSVKQIYEPQETCINLACDAFAFLFKKRMPEYNDIKKVPKTEEMFAHFLILEASLPIRIVFGYNGFKSEKSLRNSFVEYLSKHTFDSTKTIEKGFGALSFPNLIVCNNFSLIKLNGMPYALNRENNNEYCEIYGSYSKNPFLLLLELIWTRITYQFKIDSGVFEDNLEMEFIKPFIAGKIDKIDDKEGWCYCYLEMGSDE